MIDLLHLSAKIIEKPGSLTISKFPNLNILFGLFGKRNTKFKNNIFLEFYHSIITFSYFSLYF